MPSAVRERRLHYEATLAGLSSRPRQLPSAWLYDERGSRLYEAVTGLGEYYLPRREAEILRARAAAIAGRARPRLLIELGTGGATNTRLLLDALGALEEFVPFDVSESMLNASAGRIAAAYPALSVRPVVGDFERDLSSLPGGRRRLIAFLSSTIGNLTPDRRSRFLTELGTSLGESDAFLVGIDLVKDVPRLEAAYNDKSGTTEAFVRNALSAVNAGLGATFDQERFAYEARWDARNEWMEIGLRARRAHEVSLPALELDVAFEQGEFLRVEISAKFRREPFGAELDRAGLRLVSWWTDEGKHDYAVALAVRN
jgi:L-histidine N-alpha-methyltransferase